MALLLGLGVVLDYSDSSSLSPHSMAGLTICGIIGLFVILGLDGTWMLKIGGPARRDRRGSTYLRTSGPVQVVDLGQAGHILRLADRAFTPPNSQATAQLAKMGWAIVDHSRHAHVVLAVWDWNGANVYLAEGYHPDPPRLPSPAHLP